MSSEVKVQTKEVPTTWIISFLRLIPSFWLFNTSESSQLITKKPAVQRHDSGTYLSQYEGPTGAQCANKPHCVNCHGLYPARHNLCSAAPRQINGTLKHPSKKELTSIQQYRDQCYQDTQSSEAACMGLDGSALVASQHALTSVLTSLPASSAGGSDSKVHKMQAAEPCKTRKRDHPASQSKGPCNGQDWTTVPGPKAHHRHATVFQGSLNWHDLQNCSSQASNNSGPMDLTANTPTISQSALQLAFKQECKIICVQEPYTFPSTKTLNHPSYNCYAPLNHWDSTDTAQRELKHSQVQQDLHCRSDHQIILTLILTQQQAWPESFHWRVPEQQLNKFAGLMQIKIQSLPFSNSIETALQLDNIVEDLT
ncbi:hypothetical protein FQN51_008719 [Onygenales sp. PD_10]|nr:hypothetical protein FQN51_008719 [Onygenales sp. PD_10]